jgi:hypothetical protein
MCLTHVMCLTHDKGRQVVVAYRCQSIVHRDAGRRLMHPSGIPPLYASATNSLCRCSTGSPPRGVLPWGSLLPALTTRLVGKPLLLQRPAYPPPPGLQARTCIVCLTAAAWGHCLPASSACTPEFNQKQHGQQRAADVRSLDMTQV